MIVYEHRDGRRVMVYDDFTTASQEAVLLASASVRAQAGLRADFKAAHAEEKRLMAQATAEQLSIQGGDYCIKRYVFLGSPLLAFGRIQTWHEIAMAEKDGGAQEQEVRDTLKDMKQGRRQGWAFGWWYSLISPEGELGAHHIATLEKVTPAKFEACRLAGWEEV